MSEYLSAEELDELERTEKAATPGPWRYVRAGKFRQGSTENGIGTLYGPDCLIYTTPCDPGCLDETYERQASDGEWIAAARNALPKLLAEVRALRERAEAGEREGIRKAAEWCSSKATDAALAWNQRRDNMVAPEEVARAFAMLSIQFGALVSSEQAETLRALAGQPEAGEKEQEQPERERAEALDALESHLFNQGGNVTLGRTLGGTFLVDMYTGAYEADSLSAAIRAALEQAKV